MGRCGWYPTRSRLLYAWIDFVSFMASTLFGSFWGSSWVWNGQVILMMIANIVGLCKSSCFNISAATERGISRGSKIFSNSILGLGRQSEYAWPDKYSKCFDKSTRWKMQLSKSAEWIFFSPTTFFSWFSSGRPCKCYYSSAWIHEIAIHEIWYVQALLLTFWDSMLTYICTAIKRQPYCKITRCQRWKSTGTVKSAIGCQWRIVSWISEF